MPAQATYAFDNARAVQRERLGALEAALDAGTIRHLEACGIRPGWHCLELGAGGGSIAEWMCERVGPEGDVLATDLDVTVLQARSRPNLEIRVHDVLADELPPARFDLVHMRLLLAWLRDPGAALERARSALKPGGRILVEELDFASVVAAETPDAEAGAVFERVMQAHLAALWELSRFDSRFGRRVAAVVRRSGFDDVAAEGRASIWRGGTAGMRVWRLTFGQLRDAMIGDGTPAADVDRAIELCDDPRMAFVSPLLMAVSGRVPAM